MINGFVSRIKLYNHLSKIYYCQYDTYFLLYTTRLFLHYQPTVISYYHSWLCTYLLCIKQVVLCFLRFKINCENNAGLVAGVK
jgi:hypothetical protein